MFDKHSKIVYTCIVLGKDVETYTKVMFMVEEQPKLSNRRYNIQEVADRLAIYKGTIKNYEAKGIFPKPRRNPINKYREYLPPDIDILKRILLKGK